MFGVDKIALNRRAHFSDGKKIKEIVRELTVSRKVVRSGATDFAYTRQVQPRPRLGSFTDRLEALLAEDAALVHKSANGRGSAAVVVCQAVRCDTGMPSRVIRSSTEQPTRASVFWPSGVRARRPRPVMAL